MISERRLQPELMDQPDLDPALHVRALDGLKRINLVSRSAAILWPAIAEVAREAESRSCACSISLAAAGTTRCRLRACRPCPSFDRGPRLRCERSCRQPITPTGNHVGFAWPELLSARRAVPAASHGLRRDHDVPFSCITWKRIKPAGCSAAWRRLARRAVLVCDLQRSWLGYGLAWVGCRLLTASPIVHVDGPRLGRGGFAISEVTALAARSGLDGALITHHWPQRWLLSWRKH